MEAISKRQAVLLGIALVLQANMVSLPHQIIGRARNDSWLSYILAMLIAALPLWAAVKVRTRFPGRDLLGILTYRYPITGRAIVLLFVLFIYFLITRDVRMLTEFISISLLPNTPLVMIASMVAVSIIVITRGGITVIARMMEIWLPLFILLLLCMPLLLFTEFQFRNLLPFFEKGLGPAFEGTWFAVSYVGEIILLPFLLPAGSLRLKESMWGLAIGTGLLLLIDGYLVLALGVNISSKALFPLYELVRLIHVTDFLDRFDMPYILIFLPLLLSKMGFELFALSFGIKRLLPSVSIQEFTIPLGVWVFVSSFWFFQNSAQLISMIRFWPAFALICELVLPCLCYFFLHPKKENRGNV